MLERLWLEKIPQPLHQQFPIVRHIPQLMELLTQPSFISRNCVCCNGGAVHATSPGLKRPSFK